MNKEPKQLTFYEEERMYNKVAHNIRDLEIAFPNARNIDLLNVYLIALTDRLNAEDDF